MKTFYFLLFTIFLFPYLSRAQTFLDRHNTSWTDAWISCQETESPNPKRDPGHWIMYDFGAQYSLHQSKFWNFNAEIPANPLPEEKTAGGARDIIIDYSSNGTDWTELGEYTLPEAPFSTFYEGDPGPDFNGVVARYVLISIASHYGSGNCVGLSEVKFDATIATSTEIPEEDLVIDAHLSPNPASEYSVLEVGKTFDGLKYSVLDNTGRLLRQGVVNSSRTKINTVNLTSGVYTVVLYNSQGKKSMLLTVINH